MREFINFQVALGLIFSQSLSFVENNLIYFFAFQCLLYFWQLDNASSDIVTYV